MALTGDVYESSPDDQPYANETELMATDNSGIADNEKSRLTDEALADHNKLLNQENEITDYSESETINSPSQVGAGVLAGITGLFLGGPILGAITGVGAYYVASNNDGPIGDAARQAGDWAVTTGSKVSEAAKEADRNHGIMDKVQTLFKNGWTKVCQFDETHRASERVKVTIGEVSANTMEFEKKHHVMENILMAIQSSIQYLMEKVKGATESKASTSQSGH